MPGKKRIIRRTPNRGRKNVRNNNNNNNNDELDELQQNDNNNSSHVALSQRHMINDDRMDVDTNTGDRSPSRTVSDTNNSDNVVESGKDEPEPDEKPNRVFRDQDDNSNEEDDDIDMSDKKRKEYTRKHLSKKEIKANEKRLQKLLKVNDIETDSQSDSESEDLTGYYNKKKNEWRKEKKSKRNKSTSLSDESDSLYEEESEYEGLFF